MRRPLPLLLAALLVLPAAPVAAEPGTELEGPSLLTTLGVAYLEGVQLGALVAAAQEGEEDDEDGEPSLEPCPPTDEDGGTVEDGEETEGDQDGEATEDGSDDEAGEDGDAGEDGQDGEETEDGAPCLEEEPDGSAGEEEDGDELDEEQDVDPALEDDDLVEDPEAGEVTHGMIVSTVARCAPRGVALRGLAEGLRNHGAYVRAAAHGAELTVGDESYDLGTLEGAEALCASFEAPVEDEAPEPIDEPEEELDETPSGPEDDAELNDEDETFGTASVEPTPEVRGRSGDAPGRADAGPRGQAKKDAGAAGPAVQRSTPAPRSNGNKAGGNGNGGNGGNGKGKGR
jgi:hypothetical protein